MVWSIVNRSFTWFSLHWGHRLHEHNSQTNTVSNGHIEHCFTLYWLLFVFMIRMIQVSIHSLPKKIKSFKYFVLQRIRWINLIFPRMCVLFKIKAVVLYKKYLSGRWFESNLVFKCLNGIHIVPTTWYSFFVYLGLRFSKKKQKKQKRASWPLSAQVLLTCLFHDKTFVNV